MSCCGKTDNRAHLDSINAIAETDGRLALSMLDSVKGRDYNTTDEIYYDFLMVKARDNANVVHTNDSLIKRVIVFYGDNGSERYAEALYYGGRVYEDLGDYPASLKYYHKALDKLPDDKDPGGLRRNVLRRQARLLIEKRLYSQAVPYIDEVIKFDESEDDNMNLPFDYELLVQAYLNQKDYEKAEFYIERALDAGKNSGKENVAYFNSLLAGIKLNRGETDTALILIRGNIDDVPADFKPAVLAQASVIYYKNNIFDTAYYYAREIVGDRRIENKRAAYRMLMKPEIQNLIPHDTLLSYYKEYNMILEDYVDDVQDVLIQNSKYNYELHEREFKEAKDSQKDLMALVLIMGFVLLMCATLMGILGLRENRHVAEIRKSQKYIDELKSRFEQLNATDKEVDQKVQINTEPVERSESSLEKMRRELILMTDNNELVDSMSDFKSTEIYLTLCQKIESDRVVIENKELMNKVKNTIQLKSPEFKNNLIVLSQGKLTEIDRKTCMLIKLGFKPAQLAILLGITKGSVSSRRESIGIKILGEKTPVALVDKIIKLL